VRASSPGRKVTHLGAQVYAMYQEAIQVQHEEFGELERRGHILPQALVVGGGDAFDMVQDGRHGATLTSISALRSSTDLVERPESLF
jgi:hypothetical protein